MNEIPQPIAIDVNGLDQQQTVNIYVAAKNRGTYIDPYGDKEVEKRINAELQKMYKDWK